MMNKLFKKNPNLQAVFDQTAYEDDRSLLFLHYLVEQVKPETVLELGTGKGCSAAFMALVIGDGRIITVDNYLREDINSEELVQANLKSCGVQDEIIRIKGSSFDVGKMVIDPAPEIVFMDSSHIAVNLQKEYDGLRNILPKSHIIVVDDAYWNDAMDFVKEIAYTDYPFFVGLPYHLGMAILATDFRYMKLIENAMKEAVR
jgi:predicted O-methyltransferase YrrM